MREVYAREGQEIDLGKRGENLAVCVVFDISAWEKTYGEGSISLLHQRNGDKAPYLCVAEVDAGNARWPITNTEVAIAGRGRAELQYLVNESVVKSVTFVTRTAQAMGVAGDAPPEPGATWLETMIALGAETGENAEAAEAAAVLAEQSAQAVEQSENAAAESANTAQDAATTAQGAANLAEAAQVAAETAENNAKAAQKAAEDARDAASEIVGGDFASKTEAQDYANAAESNANAYTDRKIAAIPAPDVSGQIATHNSATDAHADIRTLANSKATMEQVNEAISKIPTPDVSGQISAHNTDENAHADIRQAVSDATSAAVGAVNWHVWADVTYSTESDWTETASNQITCPANYPTITCSDSFSIDADNAKFVLDNYQTIEITSSNIETLNSELNGKYIYLGSTGTGTGIYKVVGNPNITVGGTQISFNNVIGYSNLHVYPSVTYNSYVTSPSADTYPQGGEQDGRYYEYIGRMGDGARIEAVSYTGTDTSSVNVTFSFAPKIVFLFRSTFEPFVSGIGSSNAPFFIFTEKLTTSYTKGESYRNSINSNPQYLQAKKSVDGKTIYLYMANAKDSLALYVANSSSYEYTWIGIG